ncbi:MAG: NAD-dependent epimerase/dehydratase family protein [Candidatus Omnitrophica bacterium]|nr:NAD-dependent epimerase/dehydratase family protein [Candidatus Omnitrophota bacterium]
MKKHRILITGGAGFIGTHLAERFCERHKVVLYDNLRRNSLKDAPLLRRHRNVKFIKGDILDKKRLEAAAKSCNIIIHLAAIAGVSNYYKDPTETLRVNIIGTINLLEICRKHRISKFIYFSTSEVYGKKAIKVNEESIYKIGPISDYRWSYAISKIAGENLVVRYGEKYGFKAFLVRPFNIYGPRQTGEGAISNFLRSVANGQQIIINGNGSAIRAWCYIDDCIDAVEALIRKKGIKSGAFNIGNPGQACSTLELARLVKKVTGGRVPIVFKKMKRTEIAITIPDTKKAKRLIGFDPKIGLKEGLKLSYRYYEKTR